MPVKIRLARMGKKSMPFYRVVAIDSRTSRDGQALEILGTYDATKKKFEQFHDDRIEAWIKQGAQLTDSVKKLRKLYRTGSQAA
jgi:small subunit ribosomal protein S16